MREVDDAVNSTFLFFFYKTLRFNGCVIAVCVFLAVCFILKLKQTVKNQLYFEGFDRKRSGGITSEAMTTGARGSV